MTNTRWLGNKVYICIFSFFFILIKINSTFSHECILKDTTPKDITIYNSCLSQNNSKYNLNAKKFKEMEQKIKILENENLSLRNKLLNIKNKIYEFFNSI